jgi:hypothetical protein
MLMNDVEGLKASEKSKFRAVIPDSHMFGGKNTERSGFQAPNTEESILRVKI